VSQMNRVILARDAQSRRDHHVMARSSAP
jgi:hypothetical protein